MRLDKFLCQMNMGTRSEVKMLIRKGLVSVNDSAALSPEQKIDEANDVIRCRGQLCVYQKNVYYMMNKPAGVVSATKDNLDKTVLDLLLPNIPEWERKREIVPCGRLDKDTEGLLLLTDDGELVHALLSPKKHVDKTYLVTAAQELSSKQLMCLEQGVDIGEKALTKPAKTQILSDKQCFFTIQEGKFHQVKRMLHAVGNEVIALKRVRFGALKLDENLSYGESRPLTQEEILLLKKLPVQSAPDLTDVDAVIFDLDGTLVDSMWIWREIDIAYLKQFQISLPENLQTQIEGMSFYETAVYFKEHFGLSDSLDTIMECWNTMAKEKYAKEVPLKPGVKEFLSFCRRQGILLGIATSNSRELAHTVLNAHGILEYFDTIVTGSEGLKGKPAPDVYLMAAKQLKVMPDRCLVFEDICSGIQAGLSAGMQVCAVEDGYSAGQWENKQKLAHHYIKDYREIEGVSDI